MSSYHATGFLSSVNSRQTAFRSTPIVFVDRSFLYYNSVLKNVKWYMEKGLYLPLAKIK
jgi:hypothetical protein